MNQLDLSAYDQPSRMLNVLSFLCPPFGLVLYLILIGKLPCQATNAGRSATAGVIAYATLYGAAALYTLKWQVYGAGIPFWSH